MMYTQILIYLGRCLDRVALCRYKSHLDNLEVERVGSSEICLVALESEEHYSRFKQYRPVRPNGI